MMLQNRNFLKCLNDVTYSYTGRAQQLKTLGREGVQPATLGPGM
jgi:hypothetical protein